MNTSRVDFSTIWNPNVLTVMINRVNTIGSICSAYPTRRRACLNRCSVSRLNIWSSTYETSDWHWTVPYISPNRTLFIFSLCISTIFIHRIDGISSNSRATVLTSWTVKFYSVSRSWWFIWDIKDISVSNVLWVVPLRNRYW